MTTTDTSYLRPTVQTAAHGGTWPLWLWAVAVVGTAAVTALLWPALIGVPYWDDLYTMIALDAAAVQHRFSGFITGDMMAFWRPAELFLNANLRHLDPFGYLPVKLVAVGLHGLKAVAIGLIVSRLAPKLPPLCFVAAGVLAVVHPIAVSAIIQIDTVSESFAAAAIAWALLLMLDAVAHDGAARTWRLIGVAVLCALSLLGKESAVPAVAAMPLVGFIAASDRRKVLRDLALLTGTLAAIGLAFIAMRYHLGFSAPATNDGRYAITFSTNILKNLATIAGSLSFYGNTVSLIGDQNPWALLGFLPALIAAFLVGRALITQRAAWSGLLNGRGLFACALMALAATAAPSLAPAISEHNAALPSSGFLSVAIALIAAAALPGGRWTTWLAGLAVVLAVGFGLVAIAQKGAMAAAMGKTVAATRANIDTALYGKDTLHTCVTPAEGRFYSIYRLPAERWIEEEMLWARHNWPAKTIFATMEPAGPRCDLVVPNFAAPVAANSP